MARLGRSIVHSPSPASPRHGGARAADCAAPRCRFWGLPFRRPAAVHRLRAARRAEFLARALRQGRGSCSRSRSWCRSRSRSGPRRRCTTSCTRSCSSTCRSSPCCSRSSRSPAASACAARSRARPAVNTGLLALGAALASFMGTTGASMLLIRPLLTANEARRHQVHAVVFFILLVGNVGGALSPLGDPPLFIGFLKGVDFFWTTRALALPTLFLVRRAARHVLRARLARSSAARRRASRSPADRTAAVASRASPNFLLLAGVDRRRADVGTVESRDRVRRRRRARSSCRTSLRNALLIAARPSRRSRSRRRAVREHNHSIGRRSSRWRRSSPAIFVTIFPVLAMLAAGRDGALAGLIAPRRRRRGQAATTRWSSG